MLRRKKKDLEKRKNKSWFQAELMESDREDT